MTAIELSFPAGRYHATPWGRHVNEGAVEWPPSPWRLVRALIATWHLKTKVAIPESLMRTLVEKLITPPLFYLPRATTSHTRHYMPFNEGKNEKTTKIFDTFIQLKEGSAILVAWDVTLTNEERTALETLAERLGYFGRAESLVIARRVDELPEKVHETHSVSAPLADSQPLPPRSELVRLLAPATPVVYAAWRDAFTAKALAALGPKPTAAQRKKLPLLPEDLFSALHADTGVLQAAGWNLPPGADWVNYARPEDVFASPTKPHPRSTAKLPTVARYALISVTPPAITKALAVTEQIHRVICSEAISNGHPSFTGAGRSDHQHAHIFCESIDDSNAHITHVTIYAPEGFDPAAVSALRKLQWTWGFKGHELRTVLHGIGQPSEFDSPLFATSKTWRSITPFVSTRHAKAFRDGRPKMDENGWQQGSPAHDLLRLLTLNPCWEGVKIRKQVPERDQPFQLGSRRFRSLQFQTIRHAGKGSRGNDGGAAFIIEFPEPVTGPIAVGYGSHFGLGLFGPA